MNFRYKIMQFMSGRYGADNFLYGISAVAVLLAAINIFIRSVILQFLVYGLLFYGVFRFLSRNLEARQRENLWLNDKITYFKRKRDFYNRKKADKCHVYKTCPECKAVLRLPHRIGTHKTVCPRCNKEFTVKVKK